jgi:hypothetical protein
MRYEASDQVFVAMPFSKPFQRAYDTVIAPAIAAVCLNGKPFLQPRIINRGTTGSPDIHEQIFDAIIHSRLVIANPSPPGHPRTPTRIKFPMSWIREYDVIAGSALQLLSDSTIPTGGSIQSFVFKPYTPGNTNPQFIEVP